MYTDWPSSSSGSIMNSPPVGLALFAVGRAGSIHFQNILATPRAKLLYVVEADVKKASDLVERYGLTTKVLAPKDAGQVYKDPKVEGLLICTPTFTHEEIIMKGLENGKTIFCEKPVSQSIEGVKKCFLKAKEVGREIVCSFNRRFDPSIKSLRTRVRNGEVGTVHNVKASARDHPFPPLEFMKSSGGIFHDTGIHDIDMISWILNEYPSVVFSMGHAHNEHIKAMDDIDTVNIVMKFPSNALAVIDYSRNSNYGYDQRCEVFGSEGMLISENQRETDVVHHHSKGASMEPMKYSFPQRYKESYIGALDHFIDVLTGVAVNEVTMEQTLNATNVASACEEAYRTGLPVKCVLS